MHFRLLTYNIHKCIGGVDRRYRPERIIEVVAHCQPDIVLLQEVDDGVPRSRGDRQVDLLGDAWNMPHRAYQRNVARSTGHYGNAILSRFPLSDVENLDLTVPLKKRRRALVAVCHVQRARATHPLLLFNVHLGLAAYERRRQVRRLLNYSTPLGMQTTARIIAGDFNDVWSNLGRQLLAPSGFHSATQRARTFPAMLPLRSLDRIFYRGSLKLDHAFAVHTRLAAQASDHLPLLGDFVLGDAALQVPS